MNPMQDEQFVRTIVESYVISLRQEIDQIRTMLRNRTFEPETGQVKTIRREPVLEPVLIKENRSEPENADPRREWVYRLQKSDDPNKRTYEIGWKWVPDSAYRKAYSDVWCDERVCEGFWGDEKMAYLLVSSMNKRERGEI
jgi:hypothetical protein